MKLSTGNRSSRQICDRLVVLIAAALLGVASCQRPLSAQKALETLARGLQPGASSRNRRIVRSKDGVLEINLTAVRCRGERRQHALLLHRCRRPGISQSARESRRSGDHSSEECDDGTGSTRTPEAPSHAHRAGRPVIHARAER